MTIVTFDYSDFLNEDDYLGPDKALASSKYNKQMGYTRSGRRVVYYFDAGFEFIGWAYLHDRVTNIGRAVDWWRVHRVHIDLQPGDPRRAHGQMLEQRIRLVPQSNYPDPENYLVLGHSEPHQVSAPREPTPEEDPAGRFRT